MAKKNNPKLVEALLNDVNANLISPTLNAPHEVAPRIVDTFINGVEKPESKVPEGYFTIQQLLPDADPEDVDLAECAINGYQGMLLDDKPIFPNKEYLKEILEESGGMMFLEKHF